MQIVCTCICPQLNPGEEYNARGFRTQALNALLVNSKVVCNCDRFYPIVGKCRTQ